MKSSRHDGSAHGGGGGAEGGFQRRPIFEQWRGAVVKFEQDVAAEYGLGFHAHRG
jgi:hypothetical protein